MIARAATIDNLLTILEEGKARGIIGSEIRVPAWARPDSDVETFECSTCGDEPPFDHGALCGHCERYFCDTVNKACYDAHVAGVRGERWS